MFSPCLRSSTFDMLSPTDDVVCSIHSRRKGSSFTNADSTVVLHRKNTLRVDVDKRKNLVICGGMDH